MAICGIHALSIAFALSYGKSGCYTPLLFDLARVSEARIVRLTKDSKGNREVANIKSQKKRIRTNEAARVRNKAVRSELKTAIKRVHAAVAAGDKDTAQAAATTAYRKLDKAVAKGVIHKNQAANRKSGVQKLVNKIA